jgi:nitroreductase
MSAETAGHQPADCDFPVRGDPGERLRFLLSWAVQAPSRHNTQPWLFEIEGDEVRVYGDGSRALRTTDPDGRELLMACGAALTNLTLAAAHFGFATSSEIARGHRRDGLVARVWLEERRPSTPDTEELFQAIPRRRTNRLPLDGREPPEGLVAQLVREARREGASLRPVEDHQRSLVADLVSEGDEVQWSNPRWRAELSAWTRLNGSTRLDGMPAAAHGLSDLAAVLKPLVQRLRNPSRLEAERDRRRARTTRALLVLSTRRDGNEEWVAAGEAMQRILLRATAAGLTASYLNSAIEVPELRGRLRDAIGEAGVPQIMIRLGYGLEVPPVPRRSVDEVLRRYQPQSRATGPLALRGPPPYAPTMGAPSMEAPGP